MSRILAKALPRTGSVLAICAHPDDESFGLGAALSTFADLGVHTRVLCYTRGEASTLGPAVEDLASVRGEELQSAANVLGVDSVALLDYADGALSQQPAKALARDISVVADGADPELFLVMDTGGITGHPDHQRATEAALLAAELLDIGVLAWALPADVAEALRSEFGVPFVGRAPEKIDIAIQVDRRKQLEAIACHRSQAIENPVLWRRLELQRQEEHFRWLRRATW